jgi:type I restriction enzyme S subunit
MIKLVEIGKCCEIVSGSTPSRIERDYWGGNINWTSIKDLSNLDDKFILETSERITERGFKNCSTNMIPPNSLLLSSRAPIGHLAINKIELCTNQGFKSLIPYKEVDVNYLYYAIKRIVPKLKDLGNGATFKELSKSTLSKVTIPLPLLETQQRIAAILDEADALRKKTQQLIDSYDELAQSIFLDMFGEPVKNPKGWKEKKIIEVCDHPKDIKCGPFGTQLQKSEYQDNGIPLWGIPQINSNFEKYPKEFVSEEKARQLDQYSVKPFDILMSRKGNVGKCAVYPSHFENGIMHSDVLRLRCGTKLSNPIFIAYQFKLNRKLITHVEQVSSGAIMAGINVSRLKNIFVQVPPISLQNQFAQKIDLIEQQKELTKQSLKESEDLFNTLLQKAFKGELEIK